MKKNAKKWGGGWWPKWKKPQKIPQAWQFFIFQPREANNIPNQRYYCAESNKLRITRIGGPVQIL